MKGRTYLCVPAILGVLFVIPPVKAQNQESESVESQNQKNELIRLIKYQAEAKDPGIAALIAIGSPLAGIAHTYAGDPGRAEIFGGTYIGGLAMIIIGLNLKKESFLDDEEISETGKLLIFGGALAMLITKTLEAFDAHASAVKYNNKLQEKYKLDLSFGKNRNAFSVAYHF